MDKGLARQKSSHKSAGISHIREGEKRSALGANHIRISTASHTTLLTLAALLMFLLISAHPSPAHAERVIELEDGKGQIIRLPRPVEYVFIADPDIANVEVRSPTFLYVYGRAVGETSLYALDSNAREMVSATVTVSHNISRLKKTIRRLFPDIAVDVSSSDGALVLEGTVPSPGEAANITNLAEAYLGENERLINMMKVNASDQVMLRVRIAEVARTELKEFGIHLDSIINRGGFTFAMANGREFLNRATGLVTRQDGDGNIYAGNNWGNSDVNGIIDALAEDGLVNILAEPTLTAISGKRASFLAGGEFPIPVSTEENTVTIEFREFGVRLNFTPTVISKDRIGLEVEPEVSTLSQVGAVQLNNFNIPALSTRRASTTVELGSGQSFAIAGLLQSETSNDVSKFPILGDIPIVGALFRSTRFQRNETELVVIITPYITRGVPEQELQIPMADFESPMDVERLLFGKMKSWGKGHSDTTNHGAPAAIMDTPSLHGPVGFALE